VRAHLETQQRPQEERQAVSLLHYYSYRSRYNTGPSRDCSNRKYLRVEQVEEQVWKFVCGLLQDLERI
jgi:hypothetical protein